MNSHITTVRLQLEPSDASRLALLCGEFNQHLKQLEKRLGVTISNRGHLFEIAGDEDHTAHAKHVLSTLYDQTQSQQLITPDDIHLLLKEEMMPEAVAIHDTDGVTEADATLLTLRTPRTSIRPRGNTQCEYVRNIIRHDICFGIGPAGTGKTYLAVACAVDALEKSDVKRILLVRPAVEAGEKLGFLPGDLSEKINPYLRPLYDALYEMLGFERVGRLIDRHIIEVAPLAYMRGRTLNHSFVILDESQNTTPEQMKMLLTRLGFGSKVVITGDTTQIDLPKGSRSGLIHASQLLKNVGGIAQTHFTSQDVIRHTLVQRIIDAYAQDRS